MKTVRVFVADGCLNGGGNRAQEAEDVNDQEATNEKGHRGKLEIYPIDFSEIARRESLRSSP
jgi:hypothetical protein